MTDRRPDTLAAAMGVMVIAAYRPKPGRARDLLQVVRDHLPVLRKESLVTERPPTVMRAEDGTILEIFEWRSPQAIADAHENPRVRALWDRFEEACELVRLRDLPEVERLFPGFEPIDV